MPNRIPWTDRVFRFDMPHDLFPELIGRLAGATPRVYALTDSVPQDILRHRDGDTWSIQENIAHITDLEPLTHGRLDDFDAGRPLRAADMSNRLTHDANHNDRSIDDILEAFRLGRDTLVQRLEQCAPEDFARVSTHPRLQVPMRQVDLLFFHAEHDDYHIARIRELIGLFAPAV